MGKKNEENLRRQIEILKAQIKTGGEKASGKPKAERLTNEGVLDVRTPVKAAEASVSSLNYAKIRKELLRTLIFSLTSVLVLLALSLTQNWWIESIRIF